MAPLLAAAQRGMVPLQHRQAVARLAIVSALATLALLAALLFVRASTAIGSATVMDRWHAQSQLCDMFSSAAVKHGTILRERNRERIDRRLRELSKSSIRDVLPWDVIHTEVNIWELYTPYWPCFDLERVGRAGDGGKWVCGMSALEAAGPDECVIYSYGVRTETSFEIELSQRTRCQIRAFDPSVAALPQKARGIKNIAFERLGLGPTNAVIDGWKLETLETTMRRHGDR